MVQLHASWLVLFSLHMVIDPYRCTKTSSHTCRPQSTFPRGSRAPFSRHVCHSAQTSEKRILNQKTLSNSHFNPIPYTALLSPFCLSLSFWISFPLSPSLTRRRLFQWLSRSCTGWCSCPFPAPASSCSTSCSTQSSTSPPEQTSLQTCRKLKLSGKNPIRVSPFFFFFLFSAFTNTRILYM